MSLARRLAVLVSLALAAVWLLAALAMAAVLGLGLDPERVVAGLGAFTGARRRFEVVGEAGGVTVVDDYAHHPTEVAATIAAARTVAGRGKVHVLFQPHLYSRTRLFADGFATALSDAASVVVLDVYGAREEPEPEVKHRRPRGRQVLEVIRKDPRLVELLSQRLESADLTLADLERELV